MKDKDKDRYWDCLDHAMEASHRGQTEEALVWLDEALKARPDGAEAHNGRGEILWDAGRTEDALRRFEMAIEADPKFVTACLNRAELLIEEMGCFELALGQCDMLLAGEGEAPRLDRATEAEVYYLKAKAFFYLEDLHGALFLVRRAAAVSPEIGVYRSFEGQLSFELGEFEAARDQFEQALLLDPEAAHAAYYFALVNERLGDHEVAKRAFQQAYALDPGQYRMPKPVSEEFFNRAVDEALEDLPRSIREYVDALSITVQDYPDRKMVVEEGVSPQVVGLFVGVPRTLASPSMQRDTLDQVYLFKKNLEKMCSTHAELVEQIGITVRHEIGHYLGLDEGDMERLGLA